MSLLEECRQAAERWRRAHRGAFWAGFVLGAMTVLLIQFYMRS